MSTVPAFASASEAMDMVHAGLGYLAATDATAMGSQTQARCLQMLEQATAMGTAARASILAAFTSAQGYTADADYSPKAWLINRTRITKGTAVSYTAWVRRAAAHPEVARVLAAGELSESYARMICQWTDKLPEDCREAADAILVAAAKGGGDVRDLAGLAGEIYARSLPEDPDKDRDQGFEDRSVKLETTFDGAGVLTGDLTPECGSVVTAVLDALSAPAGAEDTRTYAQRYHDALQEAMRRLVTAGLLPERAGQPGKALVHVSLADLMALDGSSALMEEWTSRVRAQWAAHRAEASAGGSDGGAWLDGDAARAVACDAAMTPFVTGDVNPAALDDLVRLCVELDRLRHHHAGDGGQSAPAPDTTLAWEALEQAIIGKTINFLPHSRRGAELGISLSEAAKQLAVHRRLGRGWSYADAISGWCPESQIRRQGLRVTGAVVLRSGLPCWTLRPSSLFTGVEPASERKPAISGCLARSGWCCGAPLARVLVPPQVAWNRVQ